MSQLLRVYQNTTGHWLVNTGDQVWRTLKVALAWPQFTVLDAQQGSLSNLLRAYKAPTLQPLTRYSDAMKAMYAQSV